MGIVDVECLETAVQEQEQPQGWFVLLGDGVGHLDHRSGGNDPIEVRSQLVKRLHQRHLGDGVEVAALVEHEVDVRERLEPAAKSALRLADAFGHGAQLAVVRAEKNDDTIGVAERIATQYYPLIVSDRHRFLARPQPRRVPGRRRNPTLMERRVATPASPLDTALMSLSDSPLSADAKASFLADHGNWTLDGETINRTFVFADFSEAIGFVMRSAIVCEMLDHHPDIDIRWNKVAIALTTHSSGALTGKDTAVAARLDSIAG